MGKNQSKELRKSNENTPESEKRKEKVDSPTPTPTPEAKRSTLQALKGFATPPGLRRSESSRSRIQWPSAKKSPAPKANPLPPALNTTSIGRSNDRAGELKRAQESKLSAGILSNNNRSIGSPAPQVNDRDPISQFRRISINSPRKAASIEAQNETLARRSARQGASPTPIGPPSETTPNMSMPPKENIPLSPTTTIQSDTMANSGIYTKPTKGIFDAANKRRKLSQGATGDIGNSSPTSPPSHLNVEPVKHGASIIYDFPVRGRNDKQIHAKAAGCQASEGPVITPPREVENKRAGASSSASASRKRKSDVDSSEDSGSRSKKRMGPADFEKLAEYGMFEPGALCSQLPGAPLPYQILEHVKIYYEEGLCESLHYFLRHHQGTSSCPFMIPPFVSRTKPTQGTVKQATKLLNCICISGRGDDSANAPPAFIPPPSYLSLLTTVMIHPSYTTDVRDSMQAEDNMVLAYNCLLNILDAVGPKQANMKAAFQFAQAGSNGGRASRTRRVQRQVDDDSQSRCDDEEAGIGHRLANVESVWNTATDLWHVVGWALNCSIVHKDRWEYYHQWLRIISFAIEDDMTDCKRNHGNTDADPVAQGILGRTVVPSTMENLTKMVETKPGLKRAVAACFANGQDQSLRMFPEVWKDECNPAARTEGAEDGTKAGKIFSDVPKKLQTMEDIQELRQQRYQEPTEEESKELREKAAASFGGIQALDMRCVLLAALLDFDYNIFGRKQASREIYEIITEHVLSLSLANFSVFLSHFTGFAPRAAAASLFQVCANRLIDTKAPHNPNQDDSYDLPILIECYLPFAANTSSPEDNAKLAYCVDSMLRFYPHFENKTRHDFNADYDYGCTRQELEAAIALGTLKRLNKCQDFKPKAKNDKELEFMMETQEHRRNMINIGGNKMLAYVHNYYFHDPVNREETRACSGFLDGVTSFQDLETQNAIKWNSGEMSAGDT